LQLFAGSYLKALCLTVGPADQLVQPEPLLLFDGYYDALTLGSGIPVGQSVGGFSVAFDWLGVGTPGPQPFDIVDPYTFETLHAGTTTPEPGTLALLALLLLPRRRWG